MSDIQDRDAKEYPVPVVSERGIGELFNDGENGLNALENKRGNGDYE